MYSECLQFTEIPHTSRLFTDFVYSPDQVRRFLPQPPRSPEQWQQQVTLTRQHRSVHARTAEILERQNRAWGAAEPALSNAKRLGQGALAVVTGQQAGLFGGPAFAFYKALTAIRAAREFTRAGVDCVPVFWIASEDHDIQEINHVFLPSSSGPRRVTVPGEGVEGAPASSVRLGASILDALRAAGQVFGESEMVARLQAAYHPDATFASAFAYFVASIFSPFGLVLMDPSEPELHALAAPILTAAVEHSAELNQQVRERGRELEAAGYHQQVKVTSATAFLFSLENGSRTPIHRINGNFGAGAKEWTAGGLLELVGRELQRFSPNALLRSSVQDYLLPTALYVGGPAEIAYWAQSAPVQEKLLGRVTCIAHRFSATLVEPGEQRLMSRYELRLPDLFAGLERSREWLARRVIPGSLQKSFDSAAADLSTDLAVVSKELQALDPTLVASATRAASKMAYQLERLRGRAARAELRRNQEIARHADRLSFALYPNQQLQEREYPGAYYGARYGTGLLDELLRQIKLDCPHHQVISSLTS
ncbi:MAG: bacillithiol biosynthesis cysteine-adding enzyme BshC [Acidobacteria bacterium]|nr:bacillithiol biosynthesis cysteine-adding enzyme BshC [Acidobacteriota bacterium]